jgi:hypothetical protein
MIRLSHRFVRVSPFCAQLSLLSWPPPARANGYIFLLFLILKAVSKFIILRYNFSILNYLYFFLFSCYDPRGYVTWPPQFPPITAGSLLPVTLFKVSN